MLRARLKRRFSLAATTAVVLLATAIVPTALLLQETPESPGPSAVELDRKESVPGAPVVETAPGDETPAAGVAVPSREELPARDTRKGPGLMILADVTTPDDQPVAGAKLLVFGQMDRQAVTDEAGRCELWLDLTERRKAYAIRIEKSGFRPGSVVLKGEIEGHDTWPLKVELEAVGATAPVSGYLFSADGPAPNETVLLYAAATHLRYRATSNEDGYFELGDVAVGSYQLRVRPQGAYEDYVDSSLEVAAPGLELDIELRRVEQNESLHGRMVTPEGAVASGCTLYLRSRKSLGRVVAMEADAAGWFAVEGLAAGEVLLESRGFPRQVVRGLRTDSRDPREIEVVVDVGDAALEGLVEDESGQPLAGARVELLWSRTDRAVESSSARQATTDAHGRFRFEGFAAVEHEVRVHHAGYRAALKTVTAGEEFAAVRLSSAS